MSIHNIIRKIKAKIESNSVSSVQLSFEEENNIIEQVYELLTGLVDGRTSVSSEVSLFEANYSDTNCDAIAEEHCDGQESQSSQEWEFLELKNKAGETQVYELDYMKKVLECFDKYGFRRVAQRFKRIKDYPQYISRFRQYVAECGTQESKLKTI